MSFIGKSVEQQSWFLLNMQNIIVLFQLQKNLSKSDKYTKRESFSSYKKHLRLFTDYINKLCLEHINNKWGCSFFLFSKRENFNIYNK